MLHTARLYALKEILKTGLMELLANFRSRDKFFKTFNKPRLHTSKELYKKVKYDALKSIAAKKLAFFNKKLSESVGIPNELWSILKLFGIPKKTAVSKFNAIDKKSSLTHDIKTMSKVSKYFFPNFAQSLLGKLPDLQISIT